MGLPVEIRQNIIRLVVQPEVEESNPEYRWLTEHLYELVMITYSDHKPPRLSPRYGKVFGHQLLRVSRTCYREAGPLVYEREGFYLFNDYDWGFWWRIQPLPYPPSFEMHHAKHPIPHAFAFIRELGFQPTAEMSANLVRAIEADFPSLITLRAFRHIYLREESDGELMGQLPDVWIEFHRYVLLAAVLVTKNHSKLKYAKWCDWRFLDKQSEDSIRTMTVKLTPDDTLSPNEV